jgi:hypothetical protein
MPNLLFVVFVKILEAQGAPCASRSRRTSIALTPRLALPDLRQLTVSVKVGDCRNAAIPCRFARAAAGQGLASGLLTIRHDRKKPWVCN